MEEKGFKLKYWSVLMLFAMIPLICGVVITSLFLVTVEENEVKKVNFNYMIALAETSVENLDWYKKSDGDNYLNEANLKEEGEGRGVKGLDSSYTYMVSVQDDKMLYHPTESKVGKSVENEAVKELTADIRNGNKPDPDILEYEFNNEQKYASYCIGEDSSYVVIVTADKKEVTADVDKVILQTVIMDIVLVVIFAVITIVISKLFARVTTSIADTVKSISEGDLLSDTEIEVKSIIRENNILIDSVCLLKDKLNGVINKTKFIATDLDHEAGNVNKLAETSATASSQISTVIDDLAKSAVNMADNVQDINEQTMSVGNSIENITSVTSNLVELSNDIKKSNTEASDYIKKVSESSSESVSAMHNIISQINETNEAVKSVQEAVDAIQAIAGQTRLLALNASIEAARAGESGKGFAVVASEIGNLSSQSDQSAQVISDIVRNITRKSEESVKLTASVETVILEEQSNIKDAQNKFDSLNGKIEESLEAIGVISDKVIALDTAKEKIIQSVSELSGISEENAAETQEVSASVSGIVNDVERINISSNKTRDLSDDLLENIKYFK